LKKIRICREYTICSVSLNDNYDYVQKLVCVLLKILPVLVNVSKVHCRCR